MKNTEKAVAAAAEANKGNKHASKENRVWGSLIRRLAVQEDYKRLHAIANKLYEMAAEGDMSAIKEIGDRLDGKAIATQEVTGSDGAPMVMKVITGINDND